MSMFVLYVLAFVSGAIILTYVLSLVHICHFDMIFWIMLKPITLMIQITYLAFRNESLDYE